MKRSWIHVFLCCLVVVLAFGAIQNPFSLQYIEMLKHDESKAVSRTDDSLLKEIEEHAKAVDVPAVDARVDPVWKAIPGYSGLEINVEKSYDKMRELGSFDQTKLVFEEARPNVHLEDLSPSPIYKGNEQKPMVSLLINVAWGDEYLPEMLKVLQAHEVRATFFLDGSWVKNTPQLARMIKEEGHEIGNHAYSHPNMENLSREEIDEELIQTNDVIRATLDVTPKWFAPPSGAFNDAVVEQADVLGMGTILWSVDTIDWKKPEPSVMVERVLNHVHAGAMILMHPTESASRGLEQMITGVQKQGFQLGTVSELMDETRMTSRVVDDNNGGTDRD
ncbi:polysaccharide deacetylase family protein [Shouchella shacheensis]|uniref:polysaccharide deacetylase family protein n=1 Tax=Shouchella shacheensis TaxID=1649580 RepID=UPI00073FFD6B|nr:polysaccharide deacetylase family protein [Shouchella shacheensis]